MSVRHSTRLEFQLEHNSKKISRKDNPPSSKSNKLQAEKQKAKRKEKRKAKLEQLKKDFGPVLQHLGSLANPVEAQTTDPIASTSSQAGISPPTPVSVPSLTQGSSEAAAPSLFYHLGNLANPVEPPPSTLVTNNTSTSVNVPSLTHRSSETAAKPLFHHPGVLVNPVAPPTTEPVASVSTEEATSPTQPASVSHTPAAQAREAEETELVEEVDLVVNISDQDRAAPPSPTPSRLKSVVVVVGHTTRNRERTSSHRPRRTPYQRR